MSDGLPTISTRILPIPSDFSLASAPEPGTDLLLLAEGVDLAPECLAEMQRILYRHERHGAVSPRMAEPGPLSLPPYASPSETNSAREIWQCVSPFLGEYQVVPALAPSCALIKASVLGWCGPFNPSFRTAAGAIEEFVCRMNRRGFSPVAANRAFAHSERALPPLPECERDLLLYRYPEYEQKVARFEEFERDPIEPFAALLTPHRPRVLYDLFHLGESYSGTSEFGLNLLAALARELAGEVDLFVGARLSNRFFLRELAGYRIYDEATSPPAVFDLAFKPCQLLSWADFRRLDGLSPRLAFALLDIIGIRCEYLNTPARQLVVENGATYADAVFTISDFTAQDFRAYFGQVRPLHTIRLGTRFGSSPEEFLPGEHLLVVGNELAHKGIADVLSLLPDDLPTVVLGVDLPATPPHIRALGSGTVTRQHLRDLFSRARVVLYPSYYEGFGLPIVDALALGKPVIVLDTEINRELDRSLGDPNLHRIADFTALPSLLRQLYAAAPAMPATPRRWSDAAAEYAQALRQLLAREIDPARIRSRRALLRAVASAEQTIGSSFPSV